MTRILLTGGSGFIAAHVLDTLIEHGHSVVTTVRSQEKADRIQKAYPKLSKDRLDFAIVEDIAQEGAFDKAIVSDPPFEAVIHTASPVKLQYTLQRFWTHHLQFHFNVKDVQKELLDPAVIGTTGILKSIKKSAPSVKRVVITSSFASIVDPNKKDGGKGHVYSEADWNPVTHEEALKDPATGYRGSKTFAEKAAWKFVEEEKPNFTIATMCPPLVLGPIVHYLNSLDALNTSNQRIRDIAFGLNGADKELPPTGTYLFTDVRDLANAHVKAAEVEAAGNKRFFITAGYFSNAEIAEIARKDSELKSVPKEGTKGGDYPEGGLDALYKYDNSRSKEVLGITYRPLSESIRDTINSLKPLQAKA